MPTNHTLNAVLSDEGIDTFPDWPTRLADRLSEIQPGVFATETLQASPWDIGAWKAAFGSRQSDIALCGFAGYGIQSMAFHLYLRHGPLVLMIQTSWGGFDSPEDRAAVASGAIGLANDVMDLAQSVQDMGRWPSGQTLWIVDSDFSASDYAWCSSGGPAPRLDSEQSILGAINELEALRAPEQTS